MSPIYIIFYIHKLKYYMNCKDHNVVIILQVTK